MHLFDPESDDFNFPFIKKFLPDADVTVINLAIRHQGIIVPHGNPMDIQASTISPVSASSTASAGPGRASSSTGS